MLFCISMPHSYREKSPTLLKNQVARLCHDKLKCIVYLHATSTMKKQITTSMLCGKDIFNFNNHIIKIMQDIQI